MQNRSREVRDRARVVCTRCHSRKVRCDLAEQSSNRCLNCQRHNQECQRRWGARKSTNASAEPAGQATILTRQHPHLERNEDASPTHASQSDSSRCLNAPNAPEQPRPGYIGDQSLLSYASESDPASVSGIGCMSADMTTAILTITKACSALPERLAQALIDFYFREVFHLIPVIDREDVSHSNSSLLLRQSLYFAGSLMRRSKDYPEGSSPEEMYLKIKTLLFLNYEKNRLIVLKALCILGCWSPNPPQVVTLDSPWHWLGMSIRLALQLGLHRESSYEGNSSDGCNRRIWWYLFSNDTLQSMCVGRPAMIRRLDVDVELPTHQDFNAVTPQADIFIQITSLCIILNDITSIGNNAHSISLENISTLINSLRQWIERVPLHISLYDEQSQRRPYNRLVSEMHIMYHVTLILVYLLPGTHRRLPAMLAASIVASSCASRLYEELIYHEEVAYFLPVHGWYNLVISIPQIYCTEKFPDEASICNEELDIICLVLSQMREKFLSAGIVLEKIKKFRKKDSSIHGLVNPDGNRVNNQATMPNQPDSSSLLLNIGSLFPFPDTASPKMSTFKHLWYTDTGNPEDQFLSPINLRDLDWTFDWSSWSIDDFYVLGNVNMIDPGLA